MFFLSFYNLVLSLFSLPCFVLSRSFTLLLSLFIVLLCYFSWFGLSALSISFAVLFVSFFQGILLSNTSPPLVCLPLAVVMVFPFQLPGHQRSGAGRQAIPLVWRDSLTSTIKDGHGLLGPRVIVLL